jgi:hypothetical protein
LFCIFLFLEKFHSSFQRSHKPAPKQPTKQGVEGVCV